MKKEKLHLQIQQIFQYYHGNGDMMKQKDTGRHGVGIMFLNNTKSTSQFFKHKTEN